ncbi:MAG: mobile mystery protein A, partial [Thermodesulfobacteriota bacterium]
MKPLHKKLIQEQLDATLARLACMREVQRPARGWLRAVRESLGMSGRQFARRLGVSAPWITALEKKELAGAVTINTMRQAAEALDCVFVYAVIPRESLAAIVRRRAEALAAKRLARVSHSMLLEAQQLSETEQQKAFAAEVETLIRDMPRELWEDL